MNNKRNVLLFAVSLLPEKLFDTSYGIKKGETLGNYQAQMEPVFRYMLSTFQEEECHVVMLCTESTKKCQNGWEISTVQYYEKRLMEIGQEMAPGASISIHQIALDESAPYKAVADTISYLKELKKDQKEGEFWVDTHGSFREVTLIMEAIISLAEVYGIRPNSVLGVQYDRSNTPKSQIVDQYDSYGIFEFVSGMNEFINHGETLMLKRYYQEHPDQRTESVVQAMNTIAEATRWCNPTQYVHGLDKLASELDKVRKEQKEDTLMGIFYDYLVDSFGVLLDGEKRRAVDIIERCIEKEQYQQALTFIESLMPAEIMEHKIFYYKKNAQTEAIIEREKPSGIAYKANENYVFDSYVGSIGTYPFGKYENYEWSAAKSLEDSKEQQAVALMEILSQDSYRSHAHYKKISINYNKRRAPWKNGSFRLVWNKDASGILVYTDLEEEDYEKGILLLMLHAALKRCRNMVNHASGSARRDTEIIVGAMKTYVRMAKELYGER